MASQYDVQPTIFETITGDSLGTFVLNVWKHFQLDGNYNFLVADPVIKQGATTLPGSAYELAIDNTASTQETNASGSSVTLYGMMRITNATYAGVELNFSGKNYGSYASNQSNRNFLAEGVAGKVGPGVDPFFTAGEPAVINNNDGTEIVSDNSGQVPQWGSGSVYNVAGIIVRKEGITASATGEPLNQNKDPLDPVNAEFWYIPDDENDLLRDANRGTVRPGGMHTIHNRASSNYQQNMRIGKKRFSAGQKEFHIIHLDGTQVTGNATLLSLLGVGTSDEYAYLDQFAPSDMGTRTLIDMGDYVPTPQSSGGDADTLAELVEDQFQGHHHAFSQISTGGSNNAFVSVIGDTDAAYSDVSDIVGHPVNDEINGETRTGLTTHGKRFTEGISYIVVMVSV